MVRRLVEMSALFAAAVLEVGGDATIRAGLRGRGWLLVTLGCAALAAYGIIVNLLPIDFSKLFTTYVAFFALASLAFGRIAFGDPMPRSTWIGAFVILVGSAIVQFGRWR
jgi:drug/metabolite transporter superfamily protein YnfA